MIKQISCNELSDLINDKKKVFLLDVREEWEFELCSIEGSHNIPLQKIFESEGEFLPSGETIVVICHHGVRSQTAAEVLSSKGVSNLCNLKGGIDMWAEKIDKKMKRY